MSQDVTQVYHFLLESGIDAVIELSLDDGNQLTIRSDASGRVIRVASLARRATGWYLMGLDGFYQIGRDDRILELCRCLIEGHHAQLSSPDLKLDIERAFLLRSADFSQWRDDGKARRRQSLHDCGWFELSDEENAKAWQEFSERFAFRRGAQPNAWPGIQEPEDSITFKLHHLFELYDSEPDRSDFNVTESSIGMSLVNTMKEFFDRTDEIVVLCLNHQAFRFSPHALVATDWPVSVIPIGNYHVFWSSTHNCGVFGHPWEKSLCIFGEELTSRFRSGLLTEEIRRGSQYSG